MYWPLRSRTITGGLVDLNDPVLGELALSFSNRKGTGKSRTRCGSPWSRRMPATQ